jgi:adenylate cyclase
MHKGETERLPRLSVPAIQVAIVFLGNFGAMLLQNLFIPLIREGSDVAIFRGVFSGSVGTLILVASFLIPILLTLAYDLPFLGRSDAALSKAKHRVIAGPLAVSLLSILGWLIEGGGFLLAALGSGVALEGGFMLRVAMESLVIGAFCFVLCYYALEWYHRARLVPRYFPGGILSDSKGRLKLALRGRFLVHFAATGVFPASMTLFVALTFAMRSGADGSTMAAIWGLFAFVVALGGALTLAFARGYRRTLGSLRGLADRIGAGDYGVEAKVDTADELGALGEAINHMSAGLAERERIRDAFGKAVDPRVRDRILSEGAKLGGELKEAAILFSDIRGFTPMSERMGPDEVVALLNRYFAAMSDCVRAEGGLVNKFIGDAILAVFGVPDPLPNAAQSALRAAEAMREARRALNAELQAEGSAPIEAGIGIHAGTVLAGSIGSPDRMEYTVIGDAVNVASRVEKLCKSTGENLLLTAEAVRRLDDPGSVTALGRAKVAGKSEPIAIYKA